MQVRATDEYASAVIVDAESLRHLWRQVDDYAGGTQSTVTCIDGVERRFNSLEDLIAYENPLRATARQIEIFSTDIERSASVTIGRTYGACVSVSIRGEEQDVLIMRSRLMDTVSGMRAWYSPASKVDLFVVWSVLFFLVILVLQQMMPSKLPATSQSKSLIEAFRTLGYGILYVGPIVFIVLGSAKFRSKYFPVVSMAFGQGVRRHQTAEQVRWTVVVGFFVGLAGSAVYALLTGST